VSGIGRLVCRTEEKASGGRLAARAVERTGRRVRSPCGQDGAASLSTTRLLPRYFVAWTIFLPTLSYFKGALALSVLGRGYADFRKYPFYDIG
jgi:hypothetical protein